jgi:hypothetical protein
MRLTQARSYGRFGVDPEEVGLGYADTLVRSVFGVLVVALCVLIVLVGMSIYAGVTGFSPEQRRAKRKELGTAGWLKEMLVTPADVSAFPGIFFLLALLIFASGSRANSVEAGRSVRPPHMSLNPTTWLTPLKNPLAIRAERVDVEWLGTKPKPSALTNCGQCRWIYLGRATGIAVLYDVDRCRTLRIPEADLLLVQNNDVPSAEAPNC